MSKIVNLRQRRKRAARTEKRREAEAARARSGRGKAEKQRDAAEDAKARRRLDGHHLGGNTPPDDEPAR
jgi:hypothetical protein